MVTNLVNVEAISCHYVNEKTFFFVILLVIRDFLEVFVCSNWIRIIDSESQIDLD